METKYVVYKKSRDFFSSGKYREQTEELVIKYRVIHNSLRDFRHVRYSSRDGHAEGKHVNRGRETLQVSVLPYRCSICPPCCVCIDCCAAEFGSSGGTYELPCIKELFVRMGIKVACLQKKMSLVDQPSEQITSTNKYLVSM